MLMEGETVGWLLAPIIPDKLDEISAHSPAEFHGRDGSESRNWIQGQDL